MSFGGSWRCPSRMQYLAASGGTLGSKPCCVILWLPRCRRMVMVNLPLGVAFTRMGFIRKTISMSLYWLEIIQYPTGTSNAVYRSHQWSWGCSFHCTGAKRLLRFIYAWEMLSYVGMITDRGLEKKWQISTAESVCRCRCVSFVALVIECCCSVRRPEIGHYFT